MKIKLCFFMLPLFFISCHNNNKIKDNNIESKQKLLNELPKFKIDTIVDERDNNKYATIKIGKQTWVKGMLKYKSTKGRMYREFLYNWDAAEDACPKSYKIPSDSDWNVLFHYVYDSIIKKSSPQLIDKLSKSYGKIRCNECKGQNLGQGLPNQYDLNATIARFGVYDYLKIKKNSEDELFVISLYLEQMGFCTYGSGYKYNGCSGHDDNSYFWTSTVDKSNDHKFIRLYTGNYCKGCGYTESMPFNNKFGFNLKCLKTN